MTKYLLSKLPAALLVFGLLIIIHHFQWTQGYNGKMSSSIVDVKAVEGYAIILVSTPAKPVSRELIQAALYQNYENFQVYLFDTIQEENPVAKEFGLHHIYVREEKLLQAYFNCLSALKERQVVVHIDSSEKHVHPGMIEKIHQVFANHSIWLVYADHRLYPTRAHPRWDDAHVKAFHAELVHKVHMQDVQTIEEFHKSIFYLGNEHAHFGNQLLDPEMGSFAP